MALSGSKIWASIGGKVMDLWKQALWAIPLISLWWGKWVWANTLLKAPEMALETATRRYDNANRQQEQALYDKMMWTESTKETESTSSSGITLTKTKEIQQAYNNSVSSTTTPLTAWTHLEKFWEAIKTQEKENGKAFNNLSSNIGAQTEFFFQNIDENQKKSLKKADFIKHEIENFIKKNPGITKNSDPNKLETVLNYLNGSMGQDGVESSIWRTLLNNIEDNDTPLNDIFERNETTKAFSLKK